jgi:hypothetical protein
MSFDRGVSMPVTIDTDPMPRMAYLDNPHVNWEHIDGPLMTWAGQMHLLTLRERIALWFKMTTIEAIAQKHWPARCYWYDTAKVEASS